MRKAPCKNCFERKLLCHTMCERYQTWKKDYEEFKAKRDAENRSPMSDEFRNMIWKYHAKKR